VLPLFALANAGVRIVGYDVSKLFTLPVAMGVILGLVIGKPIGITAMTWLAVWLGVAELPDGVRWGQIVGAGVLAGIGFTMSLFVASIAFRGAIESTEAKVGILVASVIAGVAGYVALRLTSRETV
jgi:NhaA family Na+:H+ antiporter